ncbi:hypothetical protein D869_gp190 [Caulobacter phage CcrRogue]|uniref:Uncharacterized protein n=1 Tax=Caulobacter phage CcrRogue TaxID=2927986 RepID=K4JNC4_9CAUD|nr:hypothetical protein D869_gp190 [Caulobacter phage CcrRogue]AFU86724.1 hypothetical protein CcrRogue_gp242 [Caulobacter phage CcrRogue]
MTAETMTLSFRIEGAALVERARDRVIEGAWEHGLRILVEGLHGMTYEIAIDILMGKYTLGGWSSDPEGVYLTEQDPEDETFKRYKETFDFQFAGVFKDETGRIMRPYAIVDSYGKKDFDSKYRYDHARARGSDEFLSRPVRYHDILGKDPIDWAYRALHYANLPQQDIVKRVKNPGDYHGSIQEMVALFEVIHDYPKLLLPYVTNSAQEAVDKATAAGRRLEKRGYVHEYGLNDPQAEFHAVTTTAIDNLPPQWVIENPAYEPPAPVKALEDFKQGVASAPDEVSAMNRMIVKEVNAGTSMSTAIALARAKMALMGGMAEDPEERMSAINAHLAAEAERAEGKSNETYRKAIQEQAAGDYFDLVYTGKGGEEVTLKVPTAPFEKWCLWRTAGAHLAKPWKRVTYSGLKCFGDDPYHTDWVIGAGLEPEDWPTRSDDPLHKAAWDKRFEVAQSKMGGNLVVLLGTGFVTGKIKHLKPGETLERGQIGVIRNAGPDYVQAAVSAIDNNAALITENGGNVAHLVTEFRDKPLRLVRIADARKIFKDGMEVDLDLDKAWRRIYEGSRGPAPGDLYLPPEWEIQDDA